VSITCAHRPRRPAGWWRAARWWAPASGQTAVPFDPPVLVGLEDQFGNPCGGVDGPSSLALSLVGGSGQILGEDSAPVVDGVAEFPRVAADRQGTYELVAYGPGLLRPASSDPFEVVPGPTVRFVLTGPATARPGEEISIRADAVDAAGAVRADYLGRAVAASSDLAAALPDHPIAFEGGSSVPFSVVLRATGLQQVTLRDAGHEVEGSIAIEVAAPSSGGGGGCGTGRAGLESAAGALLALAALARRRRARSRT
jgi:hypothetical protein